MIAQICNTILEDSNLKYVIFNITKHSLELQMYLSVPLASGTIGCRYVW